MTGTYAKSRPIQQSIQISLQAQPAAWLQATCGGAACPTCLCCAGSSHRSTPGAKRRAQQRGMLVVICDEVDQLASQDQEVLYELFALTKVGLRWKVPVGAALLCGPQRAVLAGLTPHGCSRTGPQDVPCSPCVLIKLSLSWPALGAGATFCTGAAWVLCWGPILECCACCP